MANGLLDFDLNDPKTMGLLNIGLGILAGNTGRPGDLGQGVMGGLQNYQQMMQAQQRQKMLDQQQQQQNEEFGMKKEQFGFEKTKYQQEQDAIARAAAANPAMADMFRIDPKAAMKAAYPNANGADPYFTPIATEGGLGSFDNRTGKFVPLDINGKPLIKSTDSPLVRGAVKGAESQAAANWKPNTDIPGVVSTDAMVAAQASGMPTNNFSTPYPVTFGAPGTTATDAREGTNGEIPLRSPFNQRRGIPIQTPAEQAGAKKEAELLAEDRTKAVTGLNQAITQAEDTVRLVDELVGSEDGSIKRHPGFETAVGMSSKMDPRNYLAGTEATAFNTRLDQLNGKQFLQAFESLKGGGQITEVEGKKATDAIARMNTATTEKEFVTASRDFQKTIRGAVDRAKVKAGGSTTNASLPARSKADILKQYGVR
jgi:hypothetical protein